MMTVRLGWPNDWVLGRLSLKSAVLIADSIGRDDQHLRDRMCFFGLDLRHVMFPGSCCCGHWIVQRLWGPIRKLPEGGAACDL